MPEYAPPSTDFPGYRTGKTEHPLPDSRQPPDQKSGNPRIILLLSAIFDKNFNIGTPPLKNFI